MSYGFCRTKISAFRGPTLHLRKEAKTPFHQILCSKPTATIYNMAAVTDSRDTQQRMSKVFLRATEAADYVRSKIPHELSKPRVAIVCGSGLGGIAELITSDIRTEIDYSDIPYFPEITGTSRVQSQPYHAYRITVQGHAGKLVFGFMSHAKVPVVLLVGRAQ